MHELSVAQSLIEQVEREVERAGEAGRVTRLDLVVGRLSGVHADALRFALDTLSPGTIVENAEVHVTQPGAFCSCRNCHARTEIDELVSQCPRCASEEVLIEGGRDLLLESIELEP
ncbi:MAG: hydrogenase maturation nickel metallochaperone HypA [Planctomycetota bacterium]